ncbi:hypothetical protein ACXYMU_20240 [Pontibacter sp. CAU 1760]
MLAVLVAVLSVMPCCADAGCDVAEVATEQRDSHEDGAAACSPFYSCAACVGFTIANPQIGLASFLIKPVSQVPAYTLYLIPHPLYAIWQPPKIA